MRISCCSESCARLICLQALSCFMIAMRMLQPLVLHGLLSEQSMWLWRDLRSQAAELCHFIIESSAQLLLEGPCPPCLQNVAAFAQALMQSPQDIISVLSDWRLVLLSIRLSQCVRKHLLLTTFIHLTFEQENIFCRYLCSRACQVGVSAAEWDAGSHRGSIHAEYANDFCFDECSNQCAAATCVGM